MLLASPAALAALFLIPSFVYRGAGVHGLQIKLQRHRVPARGKQVLHDTGIQRRSETFQAFDFMDAIYSADFTVGQQSFKFVLDTGSSDLWLNHTGFASTDPSLGFNFGSLRTNVTLLFGSGVVAGAAVFAPLTLGDYTIPSQALLDVDQSLNMSLLFDNGISGLMGLSFSGTGASGIQHRLTAADSSLEVSSQTVLANVFASDPSGRSFIAFELGRDLPDGTPSDSTFSINEVPNPHLEAVNAAPRLPAFRSSHSTDEPRWAVSVDALVIAGNTMQTTSIIPDAPGGRALGLLDTGTSLAILPPDLVTAIYSSIPGAFLVKSPDQTLVPDSWVIPCTARVSVSLVLGGQPIFIDPRDLVRPLPIPLKGVNTTICINSIPIQTNAMLPAAPSFDFILGDVFLRNAFQLYDFNGNVEFDLTAPTQPYALLVPLTKEITDEGEYKAARQAALSGLPPEADITDPDFVPALQDAISSAGGAINGQPSGAGGPASEPGSSASSPDDRKKSSGAPRAAPVRTRTFWLGSLVMVGLLLAEVLV